MTKRTKWSVAGALVLTIAAVVLVANHAFRRERAGASTLSYEALTGSVFRLSPQDPFRAPRTRALVPPEVPDGKCVWGAIGRDPSGHLWIGVSTEVAGTSAHLIEFDPMSDTWHDRGAVTDQLRAAGLYRQGEGQVKIHSKIVPGADGWMYFASMDEEGEQEAVPPRWGGHLWRIDPTTYRWQHLLAVPEGLIAVSGVGRYIYALGYWNHVLYQYDTETREVKRAVVGSVPGHVSRNFLADARGHAYVPRVAVAPGGKLSATLVEYDNELHELASTPLDFYVGRFAPAGNHGIVGIAYLADGRLVFTTHSGQLYMIEPRVDQPARVVPLGWFHPEGESYAPSLFALGERGLIGGVTQGRHGYQWVVLETKTGIAGAFPLDTQELRDVLLFGSVNRDDAGKAYVGGWASSGGGGKRPIVLQIDP